MRLTRRIAFLCPIRQNILKQLATFTTVLLRTNAMNKQEITESLIPIRL